MRRVYASVHIFVNRASCKHTLRHLSGTIGLFYIIVTSDWKFGVGNTAYIHVW